MFLNNSYRFFMSFFPDYIEQQVFPVNEKLTFTNVKKGFRESRKLTTKLVFINPIFDLFLAQKRGVNNCEVVKLRIENTSDGANWNTRFQGYIKLIDCTFNVSKCFVACDVTANDIYDCIDKNIATESPIWITPVSSISLIQSEQGTINTIICTDINNNPASSCINLGEGWSEIITTFAAISGSTAEDVENTTKWGRVELNDGTIPTGTGWINLGGTFYVRPLNQSEIDSLYGTNDVGFALNNGYKLNWLLEWFGGSECWERPSGLAVCAEGGNNACRWNVISNFFSINPDNTHQANQTYTYAISNLNHLFLFQKSDILRSEIATDWSQPTLSFKDLMSELETIFDIEWWLEPNTNGFVNPLNPFLAGEPILRIEHKSYKLDKKMLNLLQPQFQKAILGKQEFSEKKEKIPQTEVFSFFQTTDKNGDFDSGLIEYSKNCSDPETREEKHQTTKFMTNLGFLLNKIPEISDKTDKEAYEGFCLVCAGISGTTFYVKSESGAVSGVSQVNGHLAWANILDKYHRYDRPQKQGILNGTNTFFSSVRHKRQQVPLTVTMCRADYFDIFDSRDQAKTQFGWGIIDNASYEEPLQQLTIQVSH